MGVPSTGETPYARMVAYGDRKAQLPLGRFLVQSFMAGFWVAIYGHACTYFSSLFYFSGNVFSPGLAKGLYGVLFTGAFVAVNYSGSELFTGNTVTMIMYLFHDHPKSSSLSRWKKLVDLLRIWIGSFSGNAFGAAFGAFLISWCSGVFAVGSQYDFLSSMATAKVVRGWVANFVLAIGCNSLVCLATWCSNTLNDDAGKILAMFYCVCVFAAGGYEHIIANFYTLSTALMVGVPQMHIGTVLWRNWIPVFLGNMAAGVFFTGCVWSYCMRPISPVIAKRWSDDGGALAQGNSFSTLPAKTSCDPSYKIAFNEPSELQSSSGLPLPRLSSPTKEISASATPLTTARGYESNQTKSSSSPLLL